MIHKNTGARLGLRIAGGKDSSCIPFGVDEPGIFISRVIPQGAAAQTERLRIGDRILKINGKDVTEWAHHEVCFFLLFLSRIKTALEPLENKKNPSGRSFLSDSARTKSTEINPSVLIASAAGYPGALCCPGSSSRPDCASRSATGRPGRVPHPAARGGAIRHQNHRRCPGADELPDQSLRFRHLCEQSAPRRGHRQGRTSQSNFILIRTTLPAGPSFLLRSGP